MSRLRASWIRRAGCCATRRWHRYRVALPRPNGSLLVAPPVHPVDLSVIGEAFRQRVALGRGEVDAEAIVAGAEIVLFLELTVRPSRIRRLPMTFGLIP